MDLIAKRANPLLILGVTAALLIPCFWQEHIQAGDLSSHLYNAWLAREIKRGAIDGLAVVPAGTNVLTDWALEALLPVAGVAGAERVVIGAIVPLFFWGAFCLISVATGRSAWRLAPCLGVLSYGVVLHAGFLNYYVSAGLCLWMLALLWRPTPQRILCALPLAALAVLAHLMPFVWAVSMLAYWRLSLRVAPGRRLLMLAGAAVALVLLRVAIASRFPYRGSFLELASLPGVLGVTGVEQAWLFGPKYLIVSAGLFVLGWILFLDRLERGGALTDPLTHLWLLHPLAFAVLPSAIQFPQYQHVFAYIPQRISLLGAIFFCVMTGGGRWRHFLTGLSGLTAALFFSFLYVDDRAFNRAEKEITALVAALPPDARVVGVITEPDSRLDALGQVISRACLGRCFNYGNYEAPSAAFRIRVLRPNRATAPAMATIYEINDGRHIVTPGEAPLYAVCGCERQEHRFCLRALAAGERTCTVSLPISPQFY